MNILNKNLLTLLAVFILIVSIPLTIYLVFQKQELRKEAEEAEVLLTPPVGLEGMEHFENLPYFKDGVVTKQVSSHDKRGLNADGGHREFDGLESYLYRQGDEYVLLDEQGPGQIVRIWFTWPVGPPPGGRIKFYFDGNSQSTVDLALDEFFSGQTVPFLSPLVGNREVSSGGYYSYLPMPFARSMKITTTGLPHYYHITYQKFPVGTSVTTFTGREDSSRVREIWRNAGTDPKPTAGNIPLSGQTSIQPGQQAVIAEIPGPGYLASLKITMNPRDRETLNRTWLKIFWDGESSPSVNAPIGSFFGSGLGEQETKALPVGMNILTHQYYSYFPMPYNSLTRISVSNESQTAVNLSYEIQYNRSPYPNLGSQTGYFKAVYRQENPTTPRRDYSILEATGKGHLVGTVLTITNAPTSIMEGDERIYVDGNLSPQLYGTGTEDFFNGGWGFQRGNFTLPVHGKPAGGFQANTQITMYRFFLSDAIPFRSSIKAGIEHGGSPNELPANYSSVAYYYSGSTPNILQSDMVNIGDPTSETNHRYTINNQTFSETRSNYYEGQFDGNGPADSTQLITDHGRGHTGFSQFTVAINPANQGVKLRRRLDYSTPFQKARVLVDNAPVGIWQTPGRNTSKRWLDSDFEIPSSYTSGKNSLVVKLENTGSNPWNEFVYRVYSYLPSLAPTPTPSPTPPSGVVPCDGNNDQVKINNAINALPASGGTVTLPGRQCNLASSINITKDNVTLQGQGPSTILYLNDNANTNVINATNKNNIYIKNLKINGNKAHQTPQDHIGLGIKLEGISRGGVESVEVYDTSWHGILFAVPSAPVNPEILIRNVRVQNSGIRRTGGSGMGIVVSGVPQNIILENNTVINSLQTGIFVRIQGNAKNIRIQGNNAQNIQGNGIHVSCDSGSLDNLWILNNTVSGMHDSQTSFGIWTPGPACDNAQKYIQNNRVLPNGPNAGGPLGGDHFGLRGNNGILTGNYSEGSHADGYAFGNLGLTLSNWTIRDNQAINNPGQGFMIYRMRNSTIANNTASGNSQDGIRLNAGWDNIRVEDNTVHDNDWRGIALDDTHSRDPLREGSLRNTLRNNCVYNNQGVEIQEGSLGDYNTFICNNVENNDIRLISPNSRILPCTTPTPCPTATPTPTPTPTPQPTPTPTPQPTNTPTPTPLPTLTPTPTPIRLVGDIDQDGDVDIYDYNILVSHFGPRMPPGSPADLDHDGDVDIFDYNLLVTNFGRRI